MRFLGINTIQEEDFTISTDANHQIESLTEYSLTTIRRKESELKVNKIEKSFFSLTNSSQGWIGTAASPKDWYGTKINYLSKTDR